MTASRRLGLASKPPPARGAVGQTRADPAKPRNRFPGTPAPDHRAPSCPMGFSLQPAGWICLGPRDPKDRALSVPRHGGSDAMGWRWVCVHSCLWDLWVFLGKVNFRENSRWSRERHACLLERPGRGWLGLRAYWLPPMGLFTWQVQRAWEPALPEPSAQPSCTPHHSPRASVPGPASPCPSLQRGV